MPGKRANFMTQRCESASAIGWPGAGRFAAGAIKKDSDMGRSLFLNSTCDIEDNKRHRQATLPFL